jgi:acetylornithine deacetylase/succinyl-diaminopimelate desuccinylase-like protein
VVAASASATVLFRLISDGGPVLAAVRELVDAAPDVAVTVVTYNPPQRMYAPPRALAAYGTYTAAYNTDLSYFRRAGRKVLFGGGSIANAHVSDEYIELADLDALPAQYEAIARELLAERPAGFAGARAGAGA